MSDNEKTNLFPFPDEKSAYNELLRDSQINKIPEGQRMKIVSDAWQRGYNAALAMFADKNSIFEAMDFFDISLTRVDSDRVLCGTRYFAEFFEKQLNITVYKKAVELFAESNNMDYDSAEALILAHELFHFLECRKLVCPSENVYKRDIIKIGKKALYSSTLRGISEIGAYGFAYGYYENRIKTVE